MREQSESSMQGARAAKNEKRAVQARPLDFSEIPEASSEQLLGMRRVGRPPLGEGIGASSRFAWTRMCSFASERKPNAQTWVSNTHKSRLG